MKHILGVPNRIFALLQLHKFNNNFPLLSRADFNLVITHEQVLNWLRDEHGLYIIIKSYVTLEDEIGWDYSINKVRVSTNSDKPLVDFDPVKVTHFEYYSALDSAIEDCFELILFNEV